jgi:ribosomal protein S1
VGTRVRAETSSIVNSGAVFQLPGGLSAYVNDQDLCWKNPRVTAEDFLRVGELEDLVITESDALQRNLRASIKLATPDPWPGLAQLASNMGRQSGEVQNVVEFGAFVRLDSGFIGLLHRSQLERPDRRLEAAKGDRLDVVIQHVDLDNRRIALELA